MKKEVLNYSRKFIDLIMVEKLLNFNLIASPFKKSNSWPVVYKLL